ncbi:MAG: glycosyltransferase family 2 protein [Bacteroidetes bacterium]|nr:glycosyltransferase family 2 protein [Bacteroidota bacterium]
MDLSLVIPLLNEAESLPELTRWIEEVMNEQGYSYEVIYIDDGSEDNSWQVIQALQRSNTNVKGIKFQRNYGKSAALQVGFHAASGDIVVTMDADLQDSPAEIPGLRNMILEKDYDLVSGWKKVRYDNTLTKNIPSFFFNAVTRSMSGIPLHDFNCGLKAYRKKVVKSIEVYGEMHRYIPVLAKWSGFKKIGEKTVEHRKRKHGVSKFGWDRFINGFLDLLSISFVGKFAKRPMHFFGLWGSLCFLAGFFVTGFLILSKIADTNFALTNKPGFYIALTLLIVGMQLFLAGYLGELIARNSPTRNQYLVETQIGF